MKSASLLLAAVLAASALQAAARVPVPIDAPVVVERAPPPARFERMPGLRSGHVWVPGHWQWNGRDYYWIGGRYEASRPNHAYAPGAWVPGDDGWRWHEGEWRPAVRRQERGYDRHCPPGRAKHGRC